MKPVTRRLKGRRARLAKKLVRAPGPPGLVDDHPGEWVALRGGTVVAAAKTRVELRDKPGVGRDDLIYHVPSSPLSV